MNYVKNIPGFVEQSFDDKGKCYKQEFIPQDSCDYLTIEYETDKGESIPRCNMPLEGNECFPCNMIQPQTIVDQFFN